jgi:uncharacterized damage-inducible protein DinB
MDAHINSIVKRIEAVSQEAELGFGAFTADQLNWQPGPGQWSIGQCLEHLIISNKQYFPQLKELASNTKHFSFWERLPGWSRLCGAIMLRYVTPSPRFRLPAPKGFLPPHSAVNPEIVSIFKAHNQQLIKYMQAVRNLEYDRPRITSPVASFVTYSLRDAFSLLANHEERHLRQAQQVMRQAGFPSGKQSLTKC